LISCFKIIVKDKFAQLSENGIRAYVKTVEPMDKTGDFMVLGDRWSNN